jgi:fused signal recognition particle receptor
MILFKNFSLEKIKKGLEKTKEKFVNKISETLTGKAKIDIETIESLEEILISADIGADTTDIIIENLKKELKKDSDRSSENILNVLKNNLSEILIDGKIDLLNNKPYIILIVGVNGVGKTTSIGKIANNFKNLGKKVLIVAADTFRAAANEQLEIWSKRAGVEIFQDYKSTDPSSVVYDALNKSLNENFDIVLIDTAGRLHNKVNLMNELGKIDRIIQKVLNKKQDETLIVIDANNGQNAILQVKEFSKILNLSGIIITKLDGTAKGGIIFNLCQKFKIPVKFIGVGEGIDDLQEFNKIDFINSLFENKT